MGSIMAVATIFGEDGRADTYRIDLGPENEAVLKRFSEKNQTNIGACISQAITEIIGRIKHDEEENSEVRKGGRMARFTLEEYMEELSDSEAIGMLKFMEKNRWFKRFIQEQTSQSDPQVSS